MSHKLFPPVVAAFMADLQHSPTHRRMFSIGQAMTKVRGMFEMEAADADAPDEAILAFIFLLEGLESGDAAICAKCEAFALVACDEWRARRELQ